MTHPLEYHIPVRPLIPASLALFGTLLLVPSSPAQNNSAASSGSAHSVGATTTSTAHVSTNSGATLSAKTPRPSTSSRGNNGPQHTTSHPQPYYYYPYVYAVPVPYAADVLDNGASNDNDPNYQGGPTVFDRRGAGPYSYIPPVSESPVESNAEIAQTQDALTADSNSDPEPPPIPPSWSSKMVISSRSTTTPSSAKPSTI